MADSNKVIAASLQLDSDEAAKNVLALKGNVEALRKEFKSAAAGTDEQVAALKKLNAAEKDLSKATDDLNTQNQKSAGHFKNIKSGIDGMPGPLGAASSGVTKLSSTFKALLANPIVLVITLIVGALAALFKAFTSTDAGAEKFEQIMAGVGATIDIIRDRILKVGSAIYKFFTGDWAGAIEDGKAAISGFGDEVAREFSIAANAAKELQEVEDAFRDLGVARAKLNRDLAETKELLTDENASYKDKKKALEEVRKSEGEQTEQELANQKRLLAAIQAKNSLSDVSDEDKDKEADAVKRVYELEEESAKNIRALNKQERTLEKGEQEKIKAARDKSIAEQKEQRQKLFEFNSRLTKLQQDNELATITDTYEKEGKALEFRIADQQKQLKADLESRKITLAQFNELSAQLDIQSDLQRQALTDKQNKDTKAKEEAFQKELAELTKNTRLKGITDTRELERVQLQIGYEEKLQDAMTRYKDDAEKLQAVKNEIDAQLKLDQEKLDAKAAEEDAKKALEAAKKKLESDIGEQEGVVADPEAELEAKQAALQAEVALYQEAFDNRLITEQQFLENKRKISKASQDLDRADMEAKIATFGAVGNAFNTLSDLVGKRTAAGKAFSVASATIAAIQSAVSSFNSLSPIPIVGPALGAVAAAGALASGYANVKKIVSVKVPGQADAGASIPTATAPVIPAAPVSPTQAGTKIDSASISALGDATQLRQSTEPTRAFVLSSDIEQDTDRNARLNRQARLGA